MKKSYVFAMAFVAVLLNSAFALANGNGNGNNGNSGAIWTTADNCGPNSPQDKNHYEVGDPVYINGEGFEPGTVLPWSITGLPIGNDHGGASCDPGTAVASGPAFFVSGTSFCFLAYTVQPGDCGEYSAAFGDKHDNYRLDSKYDPKDAVPEFTAIGAGIALLGAGIIASRRRKE